MNLTFFFLPKFRLNNLTATIHMKYLLTSKSPVFSWDEVHLVFKLKFISCYKLQKQHWHIILTSSRNSEPPNVSFFCLLQLKTDKSWTQMSNNPIGDTRKAISVCRLNHIGIFVKILLLWQRCCNPQISLPFGLSSPSPTVPRPLLPIHRHTSECFRY